MLFIIPDLQKQINKYYILPKYELLNWINIDKLEWYGLSQNLNAIGVLKINLDKIKWSNLSTNSNAK